MMRRMGVALIVAAGAGGWAAPGVAQQPPDPLARLDAAQRSAVKAKLTKATTQDRGDAQADAAQSADLDGDGKAELVLLWTFLGPTYWWSRVTVFHAAGTGWREGPTAQVDGQVQGMSIKGDRIQVAALTLGPNDPRCCPTRKSAQRLRLQGGKLVLVE
jgi:hypothetical protein